jgi:hypothetical protein
MVHQKFTPLRDLGVHGSQQFFDTSIEDELQLVECHRPHNSKLKVATAFLTGLVAAGFLFIIRQALVGPHDPPAILSRPTLPAIPDTIEPSSGKPKAWFSGPCGQYSSSDTVANCTFDLLSFSWFPDQYLSEDDLEGEREFLALENWKYELEDGKEVADIRAFANIRSHYANKEEMEYTEPRYVYTSGRWHHVHCAFMFERLQRRLSRGEAVDSYMASSGHGQHCKHIVVKAQEEWEREQRGGNVRTRVWIKYPYII